jgi:hypothetical protein
MEGEAYYEDKVGPVLTGWKAKASPNSIRAVVCLPASKPMLLKHADGGKTLRHSRDLAALRRSFWSITVVDLGQSLHFKRNGLPAPSSWAARTLIACVTSSSVSRTDLER